MSHMKPFRLALSQHERAAELRRRKAPASVNCWVVSAVVRQSSIDDQAP